MVLVLYFKDTFQCRLQYYDCNVDKSDASRNIFFNFFLKLCVLEDISMKIRVALKIRLKWNVKKKKMTSNPF